MDDNGHLTPPTNPTINAIKDAETSRAGSLRGHLDRTASSVIQREGEELREAAEQSMNVLLDLDLDGKIRSASQSWQDLVGSLPGSVQGKPIADLLPDHQKNVFAEAVRALQTDDSGSKVVRFSVPKGQGLLSQIQPSTDEQRARGLEADRMEGDEGVVDLEAQGIIIYGR